MKVFVLSGVAPSPKPPIASMVFYFRVMEINVQYVSDKKGKKKAVQVPLKEWKQIVKVLSTYQETLKVSAEIEQGLKEVKLIQSGKIKRKSISEFLNELFMLRKSAKGG